MIVDIDRMESVRKDISSTPTEWNPPSTEIQRLFQFSSDTFVHKDSNHFTEEEYEKMPSTLMKAIRRTDALLEQTEQARRAAIESNNELKGIQTLMVRYAKKLLKDTNKSEAKQSRLETGKGFHRPCKISSQMCQFLGIAEGSASSRVEVNQFINDYIKTNGLVDETNGQNIVPDEKLWSILSEQAKGNKITYFSIQKYIKQHFK